MLRQVYVHCACGISRATTSTCAYLMAHLGFGCDEAFRNVHRARPIVRGWRTTPDSVPDPGTDGGLEEQRCEEVGHGEPRVKHGELEDRLQDWVKTGRHDDWGIEEVQAV